MSITRAQILATITRWHTLSVELDTRLGAFITAVDIQPESHLLTAIWKMHAQYTECVAREIDDDGDWLDWWQHECLLGKRPMEVQLVGQPTLRIATLEDLATAILGTRA